VTPHPVVEALHGRADGARIALVIEGGGMRGVVSAGMTAAIERLGLADRFDIVVGASAGALNGAALLAGVAAACAESYHRTLAGSKAFLRPARLLAGRPAIDVRWILEHADEGLDAERHERTLASRVPLRCVAVDVDTAQVREFVGMRTRSSCRPGWRACRGRAAPGWPTG
jgi:predicted patatin/cPLA2 family phospholipase